jgi:hypothetical protein
MNEKAFQSLVEYLGKIPAINSPIATGTNEEDLWWVKFKIDIDHPFAWHAVQELGNVINYLSINDRLPTIFYPVSPAPYLNGGPDEFLSWVIETTDKDFKPGTLKKWLESRLPDPLDDLSQWSFEE